MQDRLLKLLTYFGYTATRFADEIGVQRSGISHILSGRNHPSYDFILKIMKRFPEINLDWLVLGKGEMLIAARQHISDVQTDLFSTIKELQPTQKPITVEENRSNKIKKVTNVTSIVQIVIFYSDATCRTYYPAATE